MREHRKPDIPLIDTHGCPRPIFRFASSKIITTTFLRVAPPICSDGSKATWIGF